MEERLFKVFAFSAQSVFYLDVLSELRVRAGWSFEREHATLIVPYVITCAAALEPAEVPPPIKTFRIKDE